MSLNELKLPDHAELKFKGKIFEVYQWEQELYDGTTTIFEKLKRQDTVTVIAVTEENKILITKQEQPGWGPFYCLAGGVVDRGETPLEAVQRELLEETGYQAEKYETWFTTQPVSKIVWTIHVFVARGCKKVREQELDGGEKIEVMEVTFDEFIDYVCGENDYFRDRELSLRVLRERIADPTLTKLRQFMLNS